MAIFSKKVQNILFTLAVLIILYGVYKALFTVQEGKYTKKKTNKSTKRAKRKAQIALNRKRRQATREARRNSKKNSRKIRGSLSKKQQRRAAKAAKAAKAALVVANEAAAKAAAAKAAAAAAAKAKAAAAAAAAAAENSDDTDDTDEEEDNDGGDGGEYKKCNDADVVAKCGADLSSAQWTYGENMKKLTTATDNIDHWSTPDGLKELCRGTDGLHTTDITKIYGNLKRDVGEYGQSYIDNGVSGDDFMAAVIKDNFKDAASCCPFNTADACTGF